MAQWSDIFSLLHSLCPWVQQSGDCLDKPLIIFVLNITDAMPKQADVKTNH